MASVGGDAVPHKQPADPLTAKKTCSAQSLPETTVMDKPEMDKAVSCKSKTRMSEKSKRNTSPNARASTAGRNSILNDKDRGGPHRKKVRHYLETRFFKIVSMISLFIALFGGSLFILCNVPDEPGVAIQDAIMIAVTLFFIVEIVLRYYAEFNTYPWSFFFWMDLLGTASMLFEISFIFGTAGKMDNKDENVNTLLLRAARASKVGARAGRFSKVVKVLNFLHRQNMVDETNVAGNEARVLNAKLMMTLSSKVAMLTIALVMGVPLLNIGRFPVDDLSLRAWARTLEVDYSQAWNKLENSSATQDGKFQVTCEELRDFYSDLWYRPYLITGFDAVAILPSKTASIPGENSLKDDKPPRKDNIVKQSVADCLVSRPGCNDHGKAAIYFNFRQSAIFEAIMDIAMIVFVVLVMSLESADLSQTLDRMVVKPVERMLGTVRMMAKVLSLVTEVRADSLGDEEEMEEADIESVMQNNGSPVVTEAELLENVFGKLAKLTAVFMQSSKIDKAEMLDMDYESQGVLLDIMRMEQEESRVTSAQSKVKKIEGLVVKDLKVEPAQIESWELDILSLEPDIHLQVVTYIIFDSKPGRLTGATWIEVDIFKPFLEAVRSGYTANPYHNFFHACDVLCVVFRILRLIRGTDWLSDVDMCALFISALCHDIGHEGKTNPFLLETSHELAMRYNDKSPLENMHCAKLFEMVRDPQLNVFKRFNKDAYRQARKVCINTILHTDNALHFDMVKDVKKAYEMASDICDTQARDPDQFKREYTEEVLLKDAVLWLKLILHLSDISTPLKPFWISKMWATRVQDEFFAQGDEEKRLGMPVGMLNDRDKVNRAGSEHGFISFLVSPLIFAAVGCFPTVHLLARQMVSNMEEWRTLWVATGPSPDDIKKRDDDIAKIKERVQELGDRKQLPTIRTAKNAAAHAQKNQNLKEKT